MSDKRADIAAVLQNAERLLDAGDAAGAEREARNALASDASWAEGHQLLGEVARRRGEFDAAARHYRRAIQLDGRLSCVHHALGNALQDTARLHEAIDAYRRALRLAPQAAEIWNDLGTAYFAAGQQQRAAECYRKAVGHAPEHIVALSNLGSTLRALGDVRGALGAYRRELWQRLRSAFASKKRSQLSLAEEAERWLQRGSLRMAAALADLALNDDADDAGALAIKADIALRQGDAASALELTERSLRNAPKRADLWLRLARLRASREEFAEAVRAYREARAHGERSIAAQRELALCIAGAGRFAEGLAELARLAEQTADSDTWSALAKLRLDQRDELAAGEALTRALERQPSHAPALAQLARLRVAQRKATEALDLCESALESDPACVAAHFWRGRALGLLGRWMDAAEAFRDALASDASSIAAVRWRAIALRAAERIEESQALLRDALARRPANFELKSELVVSLFEGGRLAQARELLEKLRAENPQHPGALAAMSWILNAEGRLDDAEAHARRALDIDPNNVAAHLNLGLALLKLGRYAEGWEHYEWRTKVEEDASAYLRFPYPQWDGAELAGRTILVYPEQGLGDEIMFASCLPELMRQARQVVLECDPRLGELFKRSFPGCAVFGRKRTQANAWTRSLEPPPDVQCPIASLARHLRRSRADFPAHTGYLDADRLKLERWRTRLEALGPGRKIGVSWRGGLLKTGRARRSLELAELAALLKLEGIRFVSVQYGNVGDELAMLERLHGVRVVHFSEATEDYDEAAALIGALGGVLSVCTSVVHLSGALGRPALVMAPYSAEWRYGHSGEEMPWYPSVRILRQPRPGDWAPVLAEVRRTLGAGWGGA